MNQWRLYSHVDEEGRCCVRHWLATLEPLAESLDIQPGFRLAVKNQLRAILGVLQRCEEDWEDTGFYKELGQRRSESGQVSDNCEGLGEILFSCHKHHVRILGRRDATRRAFFIYLCGLKDMKGERTNPTFYQSGCEEAKRREAKERLYEFDDF